MGRHLFLRCCVWVHSHHLFLFSSTPISSSASSHCYLSDRCSIDIFFHSLIPPPPPPPVSLSHSAVLSQFTLILWGTGPSVINPSSSDFPRPSNNSCKTFDAQQICIGEIQLSIGATLEEWAHLYWRWYSLVVTKQAFGQTVLGISTCENANVVNTDCLFSFLFSICLRAH